MTTQIFQVTFETGETKDFAAHNVLQLVTYLVELEFNPMPEKIEVLSKECVVSPRATKASLEDIGEDRLGRLVSNNNRKKLLTGNEQLLVEFLCCLTSPQYDALAHMLKLLGV